MKVLALAKKLKVPPKELLIKVVKLGISVKSVQSSISDEELGRLIEALLKSKPSPELRELKKNRTSKKKAAKETKKNAREKKAQKPAPEVKKEKAGLKSKEASPKGKKPALKRKTAKEEDGPEPKKPEPKAEKPNIELADKAAVEAAQETPTGDIAPKKVLKLKLPITVKDLAGRISLGSSMVIKTLMDIGIFATINQLVDEKDANAVAEKFGYKIEHLPTVEEESVAMHDEEEDKKEDLIMRPPVVTFMGHVDHGKTSLLDYIRKTKVTDQEKGGITQHIGAYEVDVAKGKITFLDTPGHEAFTAMRARGANATDIVVLVVAADDGIMPQTTEALDHARAAGVPIAVAINKVDKPNIDIDNVKKQLSEAGLTPEDWGGKTVTANVSAKTGQGIDELLELIVLEAELLELKANPNKSARGVIIEGKISKGGGPIATVLVQSGTLRQGDVVVSGSYYGKIRALINDKIHRVKEAPPSMPVEILGLNGVPHAGDVFMVVKDEKTGREISDIRRQKSKEEKTGLSASKVTLEDLYSAMQKGKIKDLKVILKADVRGSLGAMADSLNSLSTKNMQLNIIHKGVGDVNESDILLAAASNAIVIGFHVRKTPEAERASKAEHVDLRLYNIIYEAVSDIKAAMEGLLDPHIKEVFAGKVLIRQVFKLSSSGIIAGSIVQKGRVSRGAKCRLIRDGEEVYKGSISSLKRFKDDVKEVAEGFECGITLENFKDIKAGDIIEVFTEEKIARKL